MLSRRTKNRRGALLIEALVSFGLMFTVAITVLGLQAHARKARAKGRSIVAATCLARGVLDEARAADYDQLVYGETTRTEGVPVQREGVTVLQSFRVVQNVRTGPLEGVKSVVVTVKWDSGVVNLEGYVSR